MLWFNKKKAVIEHQQEVAQHAAIEIVAHKNAKSEAVNDARVVNAQLKKLLDANGFTLRIYLAAGGHQAKTQRRTN